MGKKRNRKRNHLKDRRNDQEGSRAAPYSEIPKENSLFETYYKSQNVVPEDQWEDFMAALRRSLPVTFRVTGFNPEAKRLLHIIKGCYFTELLNADGEKVEKPVCLKWYPDELAWQLDLSRVMIRKSEQFARLHSFLISETDTGNISRQEAVSMIPPLLLDIQPHHKVLDMCAAPGSKTAQIIEMLHRDPSSIPSGVVVANDVDNKRCYMLVHQAKRLHSPSCVITNHDAGQMPNIFIDEKAIKYDRILCDVPCTGDGTFRKNIDLWRKWNIGNGNSIHGLQIRIARRGLELLAIDGMMVYSTCSLNPIEDEAVIASLLLESDGAIELVNMSDRLPDLKYTKGVSSWKVFSREMDVYNDFSEVPEKFNTQITRHMFPPKPEIAQSLNLNRCMRLLPHQQDTGGFFVAVLRKKAPLPWESQKGTKVQLVKVGKDQEETTLTQSPKRKKRKLHGFKEDPFVFLTEENEMWKNIQTFYNVDSSFPNAQLLGRCMAERKRNLYLVSDIVKKIVEANAERIKIINTGVRAFCRSENKGTDCHFRLCQEGLPTIFPFLKERMVEVSLPDITVMLNDEYPHESQLSKELQERIKGLSEGCVILLHNAVEGTPQEFKLILCGWRGKATFRCYVPKKERVHYLRVCGVDVSEQELASRKKKVAEEKEDEKRTILTDEDSAEKCSDDLTSQTQTSEVASTIAVCK